MKRKRKQSQSTRPPLPQDTQVWRHPDLPDEIHDAFMARVRAFESAPTTTLSRLLIADGIELPPPETFTEASVRDKLWEVIHGMARRCHVLFGTDHLSDLALYRTLWEDILSEPAEDLSEYPGDGAWHIDVAECGGEESTEVWLRYYADDLSREEWAREFPNAPMPEHVDPPYDRDRHLPKRPGPGGP